MILGDRPSGLDREVGKIHLMVDVAFQSVAERLDNRLPRRGLLVVIGAQAVVPTELEYVYRQAVSSGILVELRGHVTRHTWRGHKGLISDCTVSNAPAFRS